MQLTFYHTLLPEANVDSIPRLDLPYGLFFRSLFTQNIMRDLLLPYSTLVGHPAVTYSMEHSPS